jgi:regulator of sirC expression with transglutaminase-like and TPR domain
VRASATEHAPSARESHSTIEALVTLLGRESKSSNLTIIRSRLLEAGAAALPYLERTRVSNDDEEPAGAMALEIRRRMLGADWLRWASISDVDLEAGALLIDRFGDPLRDHVPVRCALDDLATELGRRLDGVSRPKPTIEILTSYLFDEAGLRGNTDDYEDPENSYLSRVVERKLGIPVSLSVVMLLVARRLRLPLVGIGMPGHFIVRYGASESGPYLDAFGRGKVLTRDECVEWLRASGFEFEPRMLRPVDSRQIVARMLRNLVAVFSKRGAAAEVAILSQYLRAVLAPTVLVDIPAGSEPSAESAAG